MAARFDKFTERARRVLTRAQEEAVRLGHMFIGTEHLQLGLVREGEGIAAEVLESVGVTLARVRAQTERLLRHMYRFALSTPEPVILSARDRSPCSE